MEQSINLLYIYEGVLINEKVLINNSSSNIFQIKLVFVRELDRELMVS